MVATTTLYGVETWNMKETDRRKNVLAMRDLQGMLGISRMNRVRNEDVKRQREVERNLSERVVQRLLSWCGQMIKMDEDSMTKKGWKTEVSGVRVRARS